MFLSFSQPSALLIQIKSFAVFLTPSVKLITFSPNGILLIGGNLPFARSNYQR